MEKITSRSWARGYLAGMFDGEGCFYSKGRDNLVQMSNTDPDIIQGVIKALNLLGIDCRLYGEHPSSPQYAYVWFVSIVRRDGFERVKEFNLMSTRKLGQLETILDGYQTRRRSCKLGCTCGKHKRRIHG